eukprot:6821532-Prymnesium_polylepis.1
MSSVKPLFEMHIGASDSPFPLEAPAHDIFDPPLRVTTALSSTFTDSGASAFGDFAFFLPRPPRLPPRPRPRPPPESEPNSLTVTLRASGALLRFDCSPRTSVSSIPDSRSSPSAVQKIG